MTTETLNKAPCLRLILRAAVGVGNIDLVAASERGILVVNTPGKNTNSAAEMTWSLLLGLIRKLPDAVATLKSGGWDRHRFTGTELRGKKIGLVGLGHVGHRVAKFAHGFDMDVYGYDPYISSERFSQYGVKSFQSLEELAQEVDILSLHTPLTRETTKMVDEKILSSLKAGAILVNAARGPIVDEIQVLKALESGHLSGYAVDTYEVEPNARRELVEHPRVVCTPHIGASTLEAQNAIALTVAEQLEKFRRGEVVDFAVNLPDLKIPEDPVLTTYAGLCQKLGSAVSQLVGFNPSKIEILYRGHLASLDTQLLRLCVMSGYGKNVIDGHVSFVNIEQRFSGLGIQVTESNDPDFSSYKSAVKLRVSSAEGKKMSIGGIVFDQTLTKISLIDEFHFEFDPSGHFLVLENHDRPGVIGDIGTALGKAGVNIDQFSLSRNKLGGHAMAIVKVDDAVSKDIVSILSKVKNVIRVRTMSL